MTEASPAPGGVGTVLLVDDDELLLAAMSRLLRPDGLRVLIAPSGDRALELLEAEGDSIAVVAQAVGGISQTPPFPFTEAGVIAANLLVRYVTIGPPNDTSDIFEPVRGASRQLLLQYAFDVAPLMVTEVPLSRADVVVYLIR